MFKPRNKFLTRLAEVAPPIFRERILPVLENRVFGGAAWDATLAIRSGADRIFRPVHALHDRQRDRGQSAGEGLIQIKATIESIGATVQPAAPTVDELMKKIEETRPAPVR